MTNEKQKLYHSQNQPVSYVGHTKRPLQILNHQTSRTSKDIPILEVLEVFAVRMV